jgi:hypothetical protein
VNDPRSRTGAGVGCAAWGRSRHLLRVYSRRAHASGGTERRPYDTLTSARLSSRLNQLTARSSPQSTARTVQRAGVGADRRGGTT